jgi:peptidoglycan/LPS O-acetylase OafA/YrhL
VVLDGLRGLAVVLVMVHHSAVTARWPIGVDIFFCLSGLLITLMLTRQGEQGRFTLRRFYGQRFKRLAPLLALTLVLTLAAVSVLGGDLEAQRSGRQTIASVFQVANWEQIQSGQGYWDAFGRLLPLNHMWSLSVTEQFYLLWPLVLRLLYSRARRPERAAAVCATFCFVGAAIAPFGWDGSDADALYMNSVVRSVAFFAGAVAALQLNRRQRMGSVARGSRSATMLACFALTALAVLGGLATSYRADWLYQGGMALIAALAALLAVTLPSTTWLRRVFEYRALAGLGEISYALYLVHLPLYWLLQVVYPAVTPLALLLVAGSISWVVAYVLHHRVQERLRHRTWTWRRHGVATAATLALLAGSSVALAPAVAVRVNPTGRPMAVVLGDSLAVDFADALNHGGDRAYDVVSGGVPGCGIMDARAVRLPHGGQYTVAPACRQWPRRWSALLTRQHPAVILVDLSWDEAEQSVGTTWLSPCTRQFRVRYEEQLAQARDLWQHVAPRVPVLVANRRTGSTDSTPRDARCYNQIVENFIRHTSATHLLDIDARLCPAGNCLIRTPDGRPLFTDGTHFTSAGKALIAPWLEAALAPFTPAPHPSQPQRTDTRRAVSSRSVSAARIKPPNAPPSPPAPDAVVTLQPDLVQTTACIRFWTGPDPGTSKSSSANGRTRRETETTISRSTASEQAIPAGPTWSASSSTTCTRSWATPTSRMTTS